MARPSTIVRLRPELRKLILHMRHNGRTIDEIRTALAALGAPVSRSGLGRHVQKLDEAIENARLVELGLLSVPAAIADVLEVLDALAPRSESSEATD